MPHDRRSERRQRVLKEGKVLVGDKTFIECVVRDISPGGARLEFAGPVSLPREFRLHIVSADLTVPAIFAWQRRLEAGIRFTGVGMVGQVDNTPIRVLTSAA
jgi:PilZ domain